MATEKIMQANGQIRELTEEEEFRIFDRQARSRLHMSGQEFIQAWKGGKFSDRIDTPDVMYVAMLMPCGR